MILHLLFALSIASPFKNYLIKQKCASARLFAYRDALVLSCEASDWNKKDILTRSMKLISALMTEHPYAKTYSLVLRKSEVPVLELDSNSKDVLSLLSGRIGEEEFLSRLRVFKLGERVFELQGVPVFPGRKEIKGEESAEKGNFVIENMRCEQGKLSLKYSYSFTGEGKVMILALKDEKPVKTELINFEGGGTGSLTMNIGKGDFKIRVMFWSGRWVLLQEKEVFCVDNEKTKK